MISISIVELFIPFNIDNLSLCVCVYVHVCVSSLNNAVNENMLGEQVKQHRQAVYESLKDYLKSRFLNYYKTQCRCETFSDRGGQVVQ